MIKLVEKPSFFQQPAVRVGLLLVVVIVAFIIVQQLSIPKSFGAYGFYRGDNVQEWVSMSSKYSTAGTATCNSCHNEKVNLKNQGPHTTVNCESCHLAAGNHTQTPFVLKPAKDTTRDACLTCHNQQAARLETSIRQIDGSQHNSDKACITCHDPHSPWAKMGGKKPW